MDFFADPRLFLFVGACLTLVAIPGPAVAFIVARSASEGTLAGTKTAAGIAIGNLCQALTAAFGLATILNSYPSVYHIIKYMGAAYLVYLGVRSFSAKTESNVTREPIRTTTAFRQGALVGLLNPKVAVFLLAFLPQFTNPESGTLQTQLLLLGIGFVFIGWLGDTTWAVSAGFVSAKLKRKGGFAWGRYAAGAVYCAVGVATALW